LYQKLHTKAQQKYIQFENRIAVDR
jgi:hypothetical protein